MVDYEGSCVNRVTRRSDIFRIGPNSVIARQCTCAIIGFDMGEWARTRTL